MILTQVEGYMDVTVRVPFRVLVDDEDLVLDVDGGLGGWVYMVNTGVLPDGLEGATVERADSYVHEVVDSEIAEAWIRTPDHNHATRCCDRHGTHVMPHRGCILR